MIKDSPDGVVAFFPSYAYLSHVVSVWKRPSAKGSSDQSLWDRIIANKTPFMEPRAANSSDLDTSKSSNPIQSSRHQDTASAGRHESILTSYAAAIASNNGKGGLLLSVVGGSLSEGINFSDALGRAVIVVGLPFPNPHSAEWKAKAAYVEAKVTAQTTHADSVSARSESGVGEKVDPKAASRDFYENVCMRAVNQCIGRAIRHKNDYAAILLLDRRYGFPRIRAKLPGWITDSLKESADIEGASGRLKVFFAEKNQGIPKS